MNHRDGMSPAEVRRVPTTVPPSFMPNTRGILKSWLESPGGMPKWVRTPLDHFASETDPSGLAMPPTTSPLLFKASPPVLVIVLFGWGVLPVRSSVILECMVNRICLAHEKRSAVQQ